PAPTGDWVFSLVNRVLEIESGGCKTTLNLEGQTQFQIHLNPCGSGLAREYGLSSSISVA
ncbi:hypothetical protein ACXR0M_15685, partial [Pseudomonas sp. Eth.TT006]